MKDIEYAKKIALICDKAEALNQEWSLLTQQSNNKSKVVNGKPKITKDFVHRHSLGRLENGIRTPEKTYRRPILKALNALGGSASATEVLEYVYRIVKPLLKDVDFEPVDNMPRWKKAAHWARRKMVEEGLLEGNSPRGIWEIGEAGKLYLKM